MNFKIKRILATFLDLWILGVPFSIIYLVYFYLWGSSNFLLSLMVLLVFYLFLFKDVLINGNSIFKTVLAIRVVSSKNKNEITFYQSLLRNLKIFVWPIEVFLILIFNRRIGDYIAKTQVISCM